MDKSLTSRFEESPELDKAVRFILSTVPERFPEVFSVKYSLVFTTKDSPIHYAGQCQKVSDKVRFKTGLDYVISIYKNNFLQIAKEEQLKVLIHELHHIMLDERGRPRVRRHNEAEEFCELPTHDKYSSGVLDTLIRNLSMKPGEERL